MIEVSSARETIHPDDALALVLADIPLPSQEIIPLVRSLGRVLAKEIFALIDQPPFDKAAMDGYAHGAIAPKSGEWKLVDIVPAGTELPRPLGPEECARIMTGARIPEGTDAVHRREFATETNGFVRFIQPETAEHIIRRGENQKTGDILLSPRILRPQDIGLLASSGYSAITVSKRPLVGIISTGDELTQCGSSLPEGAIFDSNGPQLAAQTHALGCDVREYGIVPDDPIRLAQVLRNALEECDTIIVSGAVSTGDFDFVPLALAAMNVKTIFHGLKMRPGKPTYHGRLGSKAVFGLPGNPVSTFVNFEIIVRPHLLKRMGLEDEPLILQLPLIETLTRRGSDRVEYLPARIERTENGGPAGIRPLRGYRGSSMLSVLSDADCLVRMDIGVETIPEGGIVHARLLRS